MQAAAIHGDLRQSQREDALQAASREGKLEVLVATDVAARGLHIDDIDVVIHYDPAPDHKTYLHRSGRTARAGSKGMAVTLSIWNQELEIKRLQKRIGVIQPITEMFSNDARLDDLAAWDPLGSPREPQASPDHWRSVDDRRPHVRVDGVGGVERDAVEEGAVALLDGRGDLVGRGHDRDRVEQVVVDERRPCPPSRRRASGPGAAAAGRPSRGRRGRPGRRGSSA